MLLVAQTSLTERLIEAYNELRYLGLVKNKSAFAAAVGFPQQYWSGFEAGTRKASTAHASAIAHHFGVSLDFLIHGEGPVFKLSEKQNSEDLNPGQAPFDVHAVGPLHDEPHVDLPFPDFKALAHFGQHNGLSLQSLANVATLRIYLEPGELPERYDGAMVIEVWGDSMEPNLYSGDRMIVWQVPESKWESLHNVDCVVAYEETVTIKAIAENDLFVHDRLTLRAANPPTSYFVVARASISSIWEVGEYYKRPKYIPSARRR